MEDRHIQIDLTGDVDCPLLDYDLILRTNDEGTQYVGFNVYDYKNQTNNDLLKEWIAILQYMPKHVIPYRGMGTDKPWCEHDWTRRTKDLAN